MIMQSRRKAVHDRFQFSFERIANGTLQQWNSCCELKIRVCAKVVARCRSNSCLIQNSACIDTRIDQVHGNPGVGGIPVCERPITSMNSPVLWRDPGMHV